MPDPGSIQMHVYSFGSSEFRDGNDLILRKDSAIQRVFQCNDLRGCAINPIQRFEKVDVSESNVLVVKL